MKQEWHLKTAAETLLELGSSDKGLSPEEAARRLAEYGPNALPEKAGAGPLKIFLSQFGSPLNWILLGAALVSLLLKEVSDAAVIVFIVLLNAAIGFYQEYKAEKSVQALKKMVVAAARVLRGGSETQVPAAGLVPGDVILLASGDKVPADARLLRADNLKIEEAMLTGESLPADKNADALTDAKAQIGDRLNMLYMGTAVVSGRARAVVTGTAVATEIGAIAGLMQETDSSITPLQKKFESFSKTLGLGLLAAGVLIFALGVAKGESMREMFMTVIAVVVAAIPEGLPIVVTIAMAIGVTRMSKRGAIIRKLPAVETLGSTTVICSDKTGTLTRNEMTVRAVYDGKELYQVSGTGYDPEGEIFCGEACSPERRERLEKVLRAGLLCNESSLYRKEGAWKVNGDPTEAALLVAAAKGGLRADEEKQLRPQLAILPFESEYGYMATLHTDKDGALLLVKGAPEFVADMCALDENARKSAVAAAEDLAASGMRVLMTAQKTLPAGAALKREDLKGLEFTGLQGMIDPARPEALEAISGCRRAGIRPVMITGDHAITARAIGRELGIGGGEARVITGRELSGMSDEQLYEAVKDVSIYARVAPEHKLRIVSQLIKRGEIAAVTGDGVNDAPALKAAHIGAAMGITGTDVAKEAADMIVTDDNFASVYNAVVEGRVVFDNIRKAVFFLIPTGLSAVLSIFVTMAAGLPLPYTAIQLLWINVVTNSLQDLALAFEPAEPSVYERPPNDPKEGILSRVMLQRTLLVGALIALGVLYNFKLAQAEGLPIEVCRTVAMTTMVFFQFFQLWNSRSETRSVFRINPLSNPFLAFSMLGALVAQILVIYEPNMQRIFHTTSLTEAQWIRIILTAATVVAVVEADKYFRGRRAAGL
ncbi:MAG: HAD-IC family P-type ATPase [Elusimicrobiales bacterium]|nr:HAD-IC family P-type ATPase [Elusimicrobiales bacterium]